MEQSGQDQEAEIQPECNDLFAELEASIDKIVSANTSCLCSLKQIADKINASDSDATLANVKISIQEAVTKAHIDVENHGTDTLGRHIIECLKLKFNTTEY